MFRSTGISYKNVAWLLLVLTFGTLLRFHAIGRKSLWWDEFQTLQIAAGPVARHATPVVYSLSDAVQAVRASGQRLGYFLLLNIWMRAFGNSEAGMRSLSALFGIGALWLMYRVTKELLNEDTGRMSSVILALAPFHVYYAQEARPYAVQVFLILLSTYLFIRIAFSNEKHWAFWLGYVISALLAINSHYFSLFICCQHSLFLLLCRRHLFFTKRWLGGQAILAVAIVLPFSTLIHANEWFRSVAAPPYWQAFPYVMAKFTFADYSDTILHNYPPAFVLGVLLFVGLFSLGVRELLKNHGPEKVWFLLTWLCVPIFLLVTLDILEKVKAWMVSRYLITASPAYYIILAAGIASIKKPYLKAALLSGVAAAFSLSLVQCYKEPKSEQWREAVQYLDENPKPADLLFFYPQGFDHITRYYGQRPVPVEIIYSGRVSEIGNNHRHLNLIYVLIKSISFGVTAEDLNQIADTLSADHRLVEVRQWRGVKILRFERK